MHWPELLQGLFALVLGYIERLDAGYAPSGMLIVRTAAPLPDDASIMTIAWLAPFYLWIKAFHVVSVIAWMAGLFYLPRLYVYHCGVMRGSSESERFKVMERRLLKQIMNPAMIATWVFGLALVLTPGVIDWSSGWWHIKLLSVLLMTGAHGAMSKWRRDFLEDRNRRSHRFYRFANEIPTVLMFVIVVMVIVKPF